MAEHKKVARSLKFVMITTFYPPYSFGGDANYVRMFAHALAGLGHTVDIIYDADAYRILAEGPDPEPVDEPPGVTVHRLESSTPLLSCLATQQLGYPLFNAGKIKRILDKGQYDVIHYHNISLVGGPGIWAFGNGIKMYTAHEHWLICPTHVLWRHNKELCTERECLRCVFTYKRPPQIWRSTGLIERNAKHIDIFFALTRFSANKHKEYGFKPKMEVLPSFLPDTLPNTRTDTSMASESGNYFLFVGRLEIIKGLQDVIPVFDNDSPAELWIAGTGDYEPELRKLAAGKQKVKFLGWKSEQELKSIYQHAIAVLTPSLCYEVFPLVIIEAFRESKPIITRDLGSYPELIEQSNAGLIFSTENELKEAIKTLESDAALRERMGKAGRRAYEERWCQDAVLPLYFKMIRQAAVRNNAAEIVQTLDALLVNDLQAEDSAT